MPLLTVPLNPAVQGGGSGLAKGFPTRGHAHRLQHFTSG